MTDNRAEMAISAPLVTAAVPRAERPPVQRVVEVVGRRPVNAYTELRLAAPEIADAAVPGQFVAFAVGGPLSAALLRRSIAIAAAGDGRVTVIVSPHGAGSTWLTGLRPGDTVDVVGPLGRPFPLPEPGPAADTTTVTRPSSAVLIAIDRRSSMAEVSSPTANATN